MSTRLLLDTHVLLWALTDPTRLSAGAREAIEDTQNELRVSAATACELATKHRLGKLPGAEIILASYERHLDRLAATELPITSSHALTAGAFGVDHRDPFDRVLAAQSALEGLQLVTSDKAFDAFVPFGLAVLW